MDLHFKNVDFLGTNRTTPSSRPSNGTLVVDDASLRFETLGEYLETLVRVQWQDVESWDVGGSETATRESAAGRVIVGGLALGLPGAILAAATTSRSYQTVLLVRRTNQDEFVFLFRDDSPNSVASRLQLSSVIRALRIDPGGASRPKRRPEQWQYVTASLAQLNELGLEGWEAVGVWSDPHGVTTLCKRALPSDPIASSD